MQLLICIKTTIRLNLITCITSVTSRCKTKTKWLRIKMFINLLLYKTVNNFFSFFKCKKKLVKSIMQNCKIICA